MRKHYKFLIIVSLLGLNFNFLNADQTLSIDENIQRCDKGDLQACFDAKDWNGLAKQCLKNNEAACGEIIRMVVNPKAYTEGAEYFSIDKFENIKIYEKACAKEFPEACRLLSIKYQDGDKNFKIDYPKSRKYFIKSCQLSSNGQKNCDYKYLQYNSDEELDKSKLQTKILKKLCNDGDNTFCYLYGDRLMNQKYRLPEDFNEAKNIFQKLCDVNDKTLMPLGCYNLGVVISHLDAKEHDKYDEKLLDYTQARDLFDQSCNNRYSIIDACYYLATIYRYKLAKKKSWLEGSDHYYDKACNSGFAKACKEKNLIVEKYKNLRK
ncbi:hypothetical protein BKH41_01825 [Helicobacter sp. 12S02232-10]|uniref:sel1 repeat family protein n=1 Tax=Helicobacter sp. 12S02232-10 TaxID=1476197 RepID=UPI000BA68564|nr:sel1 repeat family protein [Helicobacter sp. 12S02232-10]PAF49431.1 hypothetical protein BKH41_01825 [Helicobacter sp. 12S02232-10]